MSADILTRYLETVPGLIREAGEITRRYFRRSDLAVDYKSDASPVTEADRETERFLRERLHRDFPGHRVVGEEFGTSGSSAERESAAPGSAAPGSVNVGMRENEKTWTWVIDPIDGTKAFVHGVPLYTVLIALMEGREFRAGAIHNPVLQETVIAAEGRGCLYNGRPSRVRAHRSLEEATICATDYGDLYRRDPAFTQFLLSRAGIARTWADGYGYLLLATGRADAMLDPVMNLWDIAPVVPIVREAGGRITEWTGEMGREPRSALAATPTLHEELAAHTGGGSHAGSDGTPEGSS